MYRTVCKFRPNRKSKQDSTTVASSSRSTEYLYKTVPHDVLVLWLQLLQKYLLVA